jgi:Tol biopolymer transport system component
MAHRSYPSPDGNWALVVEMDSLGTWEPCRLVRMDGSSPGRKVGPPAAGCTSASWSLDGKWMYLNSASGGVYHIWRQRFPEGEPEQITSGPTEEEGIAMAADGRSFITSVGIKQRAVWVHDPGGDRQISLEGYAYAPRFIAEEKRLCYRILEPGELWLAELDSGRNERLLPGFRIASTLRATGDPGYDISPDGRRLLLAASDRSGKTRLWLAPLDRRSPPRQVPDVEGDHPFFGPGEEIYFRAVEGNSGFAYRVRENGTGLRRITEHPIFQIQGVSPDGQWVLAHLPVPGKEGAVATMAFPATGGSPVRFLSFAMLNPVRWSPDGRLLYLVMRESGMSASVGQTYVVPLPPGRALPEIPPEGIQSAAEIAKLPGVRVMDVYDVAPGPTPEVYAFSRETVQRNLYRIPVP